MQTMMLTQKNRLKLTDHEFELVTKMSYHAARLYNVGLYSVRQFYFDNAKYLPYHKNYHQCKTNENYRLLLTDSSQQILKIVDRDMKSFFGLLRLKAKGKYSAKVKLPHYKKKEALAMVTVQGRSARIKNGLVHIGFSKTFRETYRPKIKELVFTLPKHIKITKLQEVRIIPVFGGKEFDIEYVYKKEVQPEELTKTNYLSIDLGLDNFATCFDSTSGTSFIIDGRYLKSINRWYNKEDSRLRSIKDLQGYTHVTDRMFRLSRKRTNQINDYFNRAVKYITEYCAQNDIGTIVVGDFSGIKQEINIGKRNNQNFVSIPYGKFRQKLISKCEQVGLEVESIEESYISKTSFLDRELPEKQASYRAVSV
jgi:IS605 OrfB family transposase